MTDFAFPLSEFYARTSLALPRMEVIPGDAVPEPYRTLLVHEADMTSTLEQFHGGDIFIQSGLGPSDPARPVLAGRLGPGSRHPSISGPEIAPAIRPNSAKPKRTVRASTTAHSASSALLSVWPSAPAPSARPSP